MFVWRSKDDIGEQPRRPDCWEASRFEKADTFPLNIKGNMFKTWGRYQIENIFNI